MKIAIALTLLLCSCAKPGVDGASGSNGETGAVGRSGYTSLIASIASTSCTNGGTTLLIGLDLNRNQVLDIDEVEQSNDICNGNDAAPTLFTPVGLVDPCGDASGIYDEVFIKLANGQIIASFSDNANGSNTRFSVLTPGNYVTTDGSNCYFSIDSTNNLFNQHY